MVDLEREIEHLQAELQRRQRHMGLLRDAALACRSGTNPQQVFVALYERVREVLPADVFFVALCDDEQAQEYHFALFIDENQVYELHDRRFGGLTGHIIQHKQPLLFKDVYQEYHQRGVQSITRFGQTEKRVRAWMGVPILTGRHAVGVLSLQSYTPGVFDENDLELLAALADLAAIAIENALLYQAQEELSQSLAARVTARSEELAVLTALAISFSQGQPISVLLDEVLERVLWLLGMDAGAIFLHERRTMLHRVAWRGPDEFSLPIEWIGLDSDSREANALHSGIFTAELVQNQAVLTIPLRTFGQTIGVMTLYGPPRELTEHERTLVEAASYQIAVGIENVRLLEQQTRQIAQLEVLANIAAVSSSTLDPRAILERVHTILRPVLTIDGFLAATYESSDNTLRYGMTTINHSDMHTIDVLPLESDTRAERVIREQRPLLIRHTDPLHYELRTQQGWERGALSWLGAPLLSREGATIGVIAIQSQRPDAFDWRDQQFLSAVAHQLALDVENAQLFQAARTSAAIAERRAENLTIVHSISRLVTSSLDPQEVLRIASEQLVKLFGVDHCGIVIYTRAGWHGEIVAEYPSFGTLHRHISFTNVEDFRDDMQYLGQPIYIADVSNDDRMMPVREFAAQLGLASSLIVPLITRGRAVGAIGLNSREPRHFAPEELELCRTIAAQVSIALENARLFQLSVTRLEQEMEIARSIQSNLFPSHLPDIPGVNLAARCVPAREVGGDFFDVLPLGNDRFGLSVGDVSGKSLPAAMLMAVARSIVRSEALDHELPEDVMCQTNTLVAQDVPPDTYVALCYAVYDAEQRTLDLALGGQLTPMIRRRDGSIRFIDANHDLPLGLVPDVKYDTTHVRLDRGDTVLFYTDGLVEAFSPEREMFGFERVKEAFAQHGDAPAPQIIDQLIAAVDAWHAGQERHDDVTIVVLNVQ